MFEWPVVPLCQAQLKDINPAHVLRNGLYRKCDTYKGGGGYDKFPKIYAHRNSCSSVLLNNQFVVQLKGCTLNCPYCYVTPAGVNGGAAYIPTCQMVYDFQKSGCSVFHLMGGAPALYMEHWPELGSYLGGAVFHSDFILNECKYDPGLLKEIAAIPNSLHAVSIKGTSEVDYRERIHTSVDFKMMLSNLDKLQEASVPFYVTFTGMTDAAVEMFKSIYPYPIYADSFTIPIIKYKALEVV